MGWLIRGTVLVAAILAVVVLPKGAARQGLLPYDSADNVTRGATLYADNCASCHGGDLRGADDWRTRNDNGRLPAPPHDASGHTWHHADDVLIAITTYGSAKIVGQGYQSDMPGFQDNLSDQEILDVLGFIKSTWPEDVIDMHNQANKG